MLQRFADKDLGQALTPLASGKKYVLRDLALLVAGALMIIVLARPQAISQVDAQDDDKGIEAMICLDISNSMLCQDVAPSRLDFAKRTISRLLERMHSDRVGLIVFAGSAFAPDHDRSIYCTGLPLRYLPEHALRPRDGDRTGDHLGTTVFLRPQRLR